MDALDRIKKAIGDGVTTDKQDGGRYNRARLWK